MREFSTAVVLKTGTLPAIRADMSYSVQRHRENEKSNTLEINVIEMRKIAVLLVVSVVTLFVSAGSGFAQGEVRSSHGDWQVRCDTPPGAKSEQCALIQNVTAEDRDNVGLSVIVLKTADQKARILRVLAPLGVLLPSGLGLRIDDEEIGRAGFVRCLPNGCIAEVMSQGRPDRQAEEGAIGDLHHFPDSGRRHRHSDLAFGICEGVRYAEVMPGKSEPNNSDNQHDITAQRYREAVAAHRNGDDTDAIKLLVASVNDSQAGGSTRSRDVQNCLASSSIKRAISDPPLWCCNAPMRFSPMIWR